ncbi:MAG: PHP domain-containing protein [Bacteroidales bacterium]
MQEYKADLHIHTILSPCANLDMSPVNIIQKAQEEGLSIIGITDHNSTRQSVLIHSLSERLGILALMGCELTSKEEAHALAFFEKEEERAGFQSWIEEVLPDIPNDVDKIGYQIVVNQEEEIVYEEARLLWSALPLCLDDLYEKVKKYNGLFIPAHVDKPSTSLMSQLGFVPLDLKADALELSRFTTTEKFLKRFAYLKRFSFIHSSDAHMVGDIGNSYTSFYMEKLNFKELRLALETKNGRYIK